ncbi:hypothetical protein EG329_000523 [Mollisiaceae sp. DMI_Dod_QoI]|nr:hypothetical protein EG329_000523 [Helotiales sp. DMI_Dod_QoI]
MGSTEPENSTSEEKVSDKAMPPAPPCEGTSKKRKGTWKGQEQGELLNPSYKQDRNSVFKDEKLLETIKASEASEEKIIHKTGLLGEQELELEMGSDRSDEPQFCEPSNAESSLAKQTKPGFWEGTLASTFPLLQWMYMGFPLGRPPDNGLQSTFNIRTLKRHLKKAKASDDQYLTLPIGFDTKVFAFAHRVLPDLITCHHMTLVQLKANMEQKTLEDYIKGVTSYKERAWLQLSCIFDPKDLTIKEEASPEFKQLAAAFFSGQAIEEQCGVVDKSSKSSDIIDLDEVEKLSSTPASILDQESPYTITYGTGDRAKVMAKHPLEDKVLATFLVDLLMSREIETLIAQHAKYKSMEVSYPLDHYTNMTRIEKVEKTLKQGKIARWPLEGYSIDLYPPDGTPLFTINASMSNTFKGKVTEEVAAAETRADGSARGSHTIQPDKPIEDSRPKLAKPKKKKKKKNAGKSRRGSTSTSQAAVPAVGQIDPRTDTAVAKSALQAIPAPSLKSNTPMDDPMPVVSTNKLTANPADRAILVIAPDEPAMEDTVHRGPAAASLTSVATAISPSGFKAGKNNDGGLEVKKPRTMQKAKGRLVQVATSVGAETAAGMPTGATFEITAKSPHGSTLANTKALTSKANEQTSISVVEPKSVTVTIVPKGRRDSQRSTSSKTPTQFIGTEISLPHTHDGDAGIDSAIDTIPARRNPATTMREGSLGSPKAVVAETLTLVDNIHSSLLAPDTQNLNDGPDYESLSASPKTAKGEFITNSSLSWADLAIPTRFYPHQRYASLQVTSTQFENEGAAQAEVAIPAQVTRISNSRVLSIQFGDVPVGYGLSLPDGSTREPRFYHPQSTSSDEGAGMRSDQNSLSFREANSSEIGSEYQITDNSEIPHLYSRNAPSPYYVPSPRLVDPIHDLSKESLSQDQIDTSQLSLHQSSIYQARTLRSNSMPCSSTVPSTGSDDMSTSTSQERRIIGSPVSQQGIPNEHQAHPIKGDFVPSSFTCVCCRVTRRPTPEAPVYFCPFCGPLTNVRCHCVNYPASQTIMVFDPPNHYVYDKHAILTLQKWEEPPSRELFRQKTFSMYCFSGRFPEICKAWAKKFSHRADTYPANFDERSVKFTGDYHIFRSEVSAAGQFSPVEVISTFRIPETDPMKRHFNRLLNACFMFAKMDRALLIFLYRLIRHFILHDSYYRHSFPAVPREILYPEFRHQFNMEFGISYEADQEPSILNFTEEWPLMNALLENYEHGYPELVVNLMGKLPLSSPTSPTPLLQ